MTTAVLFMVLALISLPSALQSHSPIVIVGWVAQTFLQLVLLPIIMVGQNVQNEASEERTNKMLKHISEDNDRIIADNDRILKEIALILKLEKEEARIQ